MNPPADMGPSSRQAAKEAEATPENWREALMALLAARAALIQIESKDAAASAARRAILITATVGCALVTWALTLAGGISWIAEASGWPWSRVALATAGLHLLVGLILARFALRPAATPAFPFTRAEFQKDREWIEKFQKTKNSND
jgi:uncharacterized membrane protein YqjE